MDRHEKRLAGQGRLMMPLKTLSRMPDAERVAFRAKAAATRKAMGV